MLNFGAKEKLGNDVEGSCDIVIKGNIDVNVEGNVSDDFKGFGDVGSRGNMDVDDKKGVFINPKSTGLFSLGAALEGGGCFPPPSVKLDPDILGS